MGPGSRVDRYEMVCPVGEGGMATVWVARQHGKHGFQKLVAFKSILTRYAADPNFRTMLLDEARIAAHIEHPNVCQIHDVGEHDQLLYLVLEYVDGDSLSAIHTYLDARGARLPLGIALRVTEEICAGLHAAHELTDADGAPLGVVHRDVSPQNVLLGVRGAVKLIDFGIAIARDRMAEETSHGSLKGKVNYMAPEQARAERIDRTADVWGVGATLYKLLSGRAPFQAGSDAATLTRLLTASEPDPLPSTVPDPVVQVVRRALRSEPGARYPTTAAMQRDLEVARQALGIDVRRDELAAFTKESLSERARARRAELKGLMAELAPDSRSQPVIPELSMPSRVGAPVGDGMVVSTAEPSIEEVSLSDLGGSLEATQPSIGVDPRTRTPVSAAVISAMPESAPPVSAPPPTPAAPAGFFDVHALIENEGNSPDHERPVPRERRPAVEPPKAGRPAKATREATAAPAIELAVEPSNWKKPPPKRFRWQPLAALAGVLGLVAALVIFGLPEIAKRRVILAAADRGVTLTIGRAALTTSGVELSDISIRFASATGMSGTVKEFRTDITGQTLTVTDLDLVVEGSADKVARDIESLKQRAGTASSLKQVELRGLRVKWQGAPAPLTMVEASGGGFEIGTQKTFGDDMRGSFSKIVLSTTEGTVGPWSMYVDQERERRRYRLVFDPPVPDGPHVLYATGGPSDHISLRVPRSPISRFGIPPKLFGIDSPEPPDVEATADGTYQPQSQKLDLDIKLGVFAIKSAKGPVDLKAHVQFAGDPQRPLDMVKGTAEIGAFTAELTGTLGFHSAGLRVDGSFRTTQMTCDRLARLQAEKSLGSFGGWFVDVVRSSGLATATGTLNIHGTFAFDTKTPRDARLAWLTRETCGLKLLPGMP